MKRLLLSLALLAASGGEAVRMQAQGSVPGGPADLVAVGEGGQTVAVTSAAQLGLFRPGGERLALLLPTGSSLTSLVPAGQDFLALDRSGTLLRVHDRQVAILARDLCPTPGRLPGPPQLAFAADTFAVRCGDVVLVGQPGQWRKLALPPSAAPLPFTALALGRDGRQLAVLQGEKVLRYALPSLDALPTLTRLPGEDTTFMDEPLTPAAASALAFDLAGKRLAVG